MTIWLAIFGQKCSCALAKIFASAAIRSDGSKNRWHLGPIADSVSSGTGGSAMAGQPGFFDGDERLKALSAAGDPLERLALVVDFEVFRGELEAALSRSDRSKGGRPPYDPVIMFKVLVLQTLYTLSDEQTEYQLKDRLSFMRFIGLARHDPVPDAKTIWLYREQLARAGAVERLFARFDELLRARGWLAMGGQIVDATVIEARRPRLTQAEKDTIKGGEIPATWKPARRSQIDRDGRWTLKRGKKREVPPSEGQQRQAEIAVPMFGYKNHIGVDREHGFLRRYTVTHAARYDGSQLGAVLDRDNTASDVWADTAYRSVANLALLERRGLKPQFQRKKPRGRKMPAHIARGNATRARVRARVEHVFAAQKCRLGLIVRTVGMIRARAKIGMANLVYNFTRLAWLNGRTAPA
jgi:transposase, IS5 family